MDDHTNAALGHHHRQSSPGACRLQFPRLTHTVQQGGPQAGISRSGSTAVVFNNDDDVTTGRTALLALCHSHSDRLRPSVPDRVAQTFFDDTSHISRDPS